MRQAASHDVSCAGVNRSQLFWRTPLHSLAGKLKDWRTKTQSRSQVRWNQTPPFQHVLVRRRSHRSDVSLVVDALKRPERHRRRRIILDADATRLIDIDRRSVDDELDCVRRKTEILVLSAD